MPATDDIGLLREFAAQNSEQAFATLVARHVGLVHSAALRQTRNPHAAEEITQAVFIILARKAASLSDKVVLSGWLYQTTRLTAANYLRAEIRRVRREQEAQMQSIVNETDAGETETWQHIVPLLEAAMGSLSDSDRNAIVLRYFENRGMERNRRHAERARSQRPQARDSRGGTAAEIFQQTRRGIVFGRHCRRDLRQLGPGRARWISHIGFVGRGSEWFGGSR